MELRKLELENFGKFQDFHLELGSNIQLIYGKNESGKSTLHSFIKSMLFGMERKRGRASAKDVFKKYEPWKNGNYYAGAIEFESQGKRYRIHRNFDKYAKSEELACISDGRRLSMEQLGELLGNISESGFENTWYIGQMRTATQKELSEELTDYAANCSITGDENLHLSRAREYLLNCGRELKRQERVLQEEKQEERRRLEQEAKYIRRDLHQLEREKESWDDTDELEVSDSGIRKWWVLLAGAILFVLAIFCLAKPWQQIVEVMILLFCGFFIGKSRKNAQPENEKHSWEAERWEQNWQEKRTQYENIQEQLQELSELSDAQREIQTKIYANKLAYERMEEVVKNMQNSWGDKLHEKASEYIQMITGGRYERITIDEDFHLNLWEENRPVELDQVSLGTIEQSYLAYRLAAGEILYGEKYPIILDDTFAFYDEERLSNTLKLLSDLKRQVIIFSCHTREEEVMRQLGITYNKVEL